MAGAVSMSPPTVIVVWVHLAATLYLAGLIWTVQVVHYPLMDRVERRHFDEFHRRHALRIGWIVIPPMVVELITSALLALSPPQGVPRALPAIGVALVAIVWLSTFAIQVPLHRRLARGFDDAAHRALVRGNWLRTVAWSLRAVVAVAIAMAATR
jgi:hypothetical protein